MIGRVLAAILGLGLLVTAGVMLVAPLTWYETLPGVSASGPFNAHFARDLGCANLVAGVALLVGAAARRPPVSALVGVGGFLGLHAGVHLWELLGASDASHRLGRDLTTVYLPAILSLWLAIAALNATSRRVAVHGRRQRAGNGGERGHREAVTSENGLPVPRQ